jgi:hypothetical protein
VSNHGQRSLRLNNVTVDRVPWRGVAEEITTISGVAGYVRLPRLCRGDKPPTRQFLVKRSIYFDGTISTTCSGMGHPQAQFAAR